MAALSALHRPALPIAFGLWVLNRSPQQTAFSGVSSRNVNRLDQSIENKKQAIND